MASVAFEDLRWGPRDFATRLYCEHSEWVTRYCRRQLGDRADAEDAAQTTFLYAFRALRRGVLPECERGWLTTIARNACHTQRRTSQRRPETTDLDLDRIALAQPDLEEVGFLDDVRAALASLPDNQRRALVLREWQGVPSNEIAEELQLSEPATHALLFRARRSFVTAMSASRRPLAGLNVAVLLDQLRGWMKPLLGGAIAKVAIVTTATAVAVGGVALEQRVDRGAPPTSAPPSVPAQPQLGSSLEVGTIAGREANPRRGGPGSAGPTSRVASVSSRRLAPGTASGGETGVHTRRRAGDVSTPPESSSQPGSARPSPAGTATVPLPPVETPIPDTPDLPTILGEELPADFSPPLDELLQHVEAPPSPALPAAPVPEPELPLP